MKKKILSKLLVVSLMTASLLFSGCGAQETGGKTENSLVEKAQKTEGKIKSIKISEDIKCYQYQPVDAEDIIIEYSGLKPDKKLSEYEGRYILGSKVYLGDTLSVYLDDDKSFEVDIDDYVPYVDIDWGWVVEDRDLYNCMRDNIEVDAGDFEAVVTYADGTTGYIDAESVNLKNNGNYMTVSIGFRDEVFQEKIDIHESWGDGESLSSGVPEETVVTSAVSSEVADSKDTDVYGNNYTKVFSEADAPGLVDLDWDAFNVINKYYELPEDVFEILGRDPRINNDWSDVNKESHYTTAYDGAYNFIRSLKYSYDTSLAFREGIANYANIGISPINSRDVENANYDYGYEDCDNSKIYKLLSEDECYTKCCNKIDFLTYLYGGAYDDLEYVNSYISCYKEDYKFFVDQFVNFLSRSEEYASGFTHDDVEFIFREYYDDFLEKVNSSKYCQADLNVRCMDRAMRDKAPELYQAYHDSVAKKFSVVGLDYDAYLSNVEDFAFYAPEYDDRYIK